MIVTALQSFIHNGIRARRGDQLDLVSTTATKLREAGLVTFGGLPGDPSPNTAGAKSFASPAVPVAPQTTLSESDDGDSAPAKKKKKRKKKASSEPSS